MSVYLASYSDKKFFKSQKTLRKSAKKVGIDHILEFNDLWLKNQEAFFNENHKILQAKRGAGYWLWKPFIINYILNKMKDDDILFYLDSATQFVGDIEPLLNIVRIKNMILFSNDDHLNSTWTKRDCFYYMNCDTEQYHTGSQISACYIVFKKCDYTVKLVSEWLSYAKDERIISDNENLCGLPNLPDFKDHRHDQSILSILGIKYNIEIFRDPSQWGNIYKAKELRDENEFLHKEYVTDSFKNSPYKTIIHTHRGKLPLNNVDKLEYQFIKIKESIKAFLS